MPTTYYTSSNGMLLGERTDGGTRIDYVPDALGNVIACVDENLNTKFTASYKPYGAMLASSGTEPDYTNVGKLNYDSAAGRPYAEFHAGARIGSTTTGRWTSVDPTWPRELAYIYVRCNPLLKSDPRGLCAVKEAVSCSATKMTVKLSKQPIVCTEDADNYFISAYILADLRCEITCQPCLSPGCLTSAAMWQWKTGSFVNQVSYPSTYDGSPQCGPISGGGCSFEQRGKDGPGLSTGNFDNQAETCNYTVQPTPILKTLVGEQLNVGASFMTCCHAPAAGIYPPYVGDCQAYVCWGYTLSITKRSNGQGNYCNGQLDIDINGQSYPCGPYRL